MTTQLPTTPGVAAPTAPESGRSVVAGSAAGGDEVSRHQVLGDWTRLIVATMARIVLFATVGSLLWTALPALLGWTSTTVMSDSMAPRIRTGDVVVSMPVDASQLTVGRVLLVHDPDHPDRLRLHRFVGLTDDRRLITRGDANDHDDSSPVDPADVVGVAVIRAPWVGLPFVWATEGRWMLDAAAAGSVVALLALAGIDSHLRRARDEHDRIRPRQRRRGPRVEVAVGATALVVVAGLVVANGAHAAFSSTTTNPTSNLTTAADFACWPTATAADSPVFYYAFDGTGATAVDRSGNSRIGTIGAGATRVAGGCVAGSSPSLALTSVATSNVLVAAGTPASTNPAAASVEVWVKIAAGASAGRIMGFSNGTARDHELTLTAAGRIAFTVGSTTVTGTTDVRDGQWHHIMATQYQGVLGILLGTMTVYVDGASNGSISSLGGYPSGTVSGGTWRIGTDGSATGVVGQIDNAAAYTATLSAAQVSAHFAVGH